VRIKKEAGAKIYIPPNVDCGKYVWKGIINEGKIIRESQMIPQEGGGQIGKDSCGGTREE